MWDKKFENKSEQKQKAKCEILTECREGGGSMGPQSSCGTETGGDSDEYSHGRVGKG